MTLDGKRRGQPLAALGVLLALWVGARAVFWESPFAEKGAEQLVIPGPPVPGTSSAKALSVDLGPHFESFPNGAIALGDRRGILTRIGWAPKHGSHEAGQQIRPEKFTPPDAPPLIAGGQSENLPTDFPAGSIRSPGKSPAGPVPKMPPQRRWRVDGWLYWREGSASQNLPAVIRPASYGASQAGAILRYRIGGENAPSLFLRTTTALTTPAEPTVAMGATMRPLKHLPIALYGEARVTAFNGNWSLQPAAYAVTELPPIHVTNKTSVEAYAQAGYVGGELATPFADAQVKIERRIASSKGIDLHVGAGGWGGIQEDAGRLDIGPTASARFSIGEVPVRLSADYRVRVAGNAAPGSGLAVTLSSGF